MNDTIHIFLNFVIIIYNIIDNIISLKLSLISSLENIDQFIVFMR